jgi:DNA-binding cell septation regulator SpoVG
VQVSEIKIQLIKPQGGLIAFASLVVNDSLFLTGIGIHRKLDGTGFRLTYPNRKVGEQSFEIFHPINRAMSRVMEDAIFAAVKNVLKRLDQNAGHTYARVA